MDLHGAERRGSGADGDRAPVEEDCNVEEEERKGEGRASHGGGGRSYVLHASLARIYQRLARPPHRREVELAQVHVGERVQQGGILEDSRREALPQGLRGSRRMQWWWARASSASWWRAH